MNRETDRLEAMRAHLDPNRRASTKLEPSLPKDQTTNSENELSGAAAVHKMAQLESNFLTQSLSGGMQNLFGAKAAAAAAAFAGLAAQPSLTDRPNLKFEDTKSKQFNKFSFKLDECCHERTRSSWPQGRASWQISGFHMKQTAKIFSIYLIYDFLKPLKI